MRKLRPDEYPTENLPKLATQVTTPTPRRPLVRRLFDENRHDDGDKDADKVEQQPTQDIGVNTDRVQEVEKLETRICELEEEIKELTESEPKFSLESIASDDVKVAFYTGFPSYDHLKICFDFLGPAAA